MLFFIIYMKGTNITGLQELCACALVINGVCIGEYWFVLKFMCACALVCMCSSVLETAAPNCIKQFGWLPELNRHILANQVWRYNWNNCFNCNVKPDWPELAGKKPVIQSISLYNLVLVCCWASIDLAGMFWSIFCCVLALIGVTLCLALPPRAPSWWRYGSAPRTPSGSPGSSPAPPETHTKLKHG